MDTDAVNDWRCINLPHVLCIDAEEELPTPRGCSAAFAATLFMQIVDDSSSSSSQREEAIIILSMMIVVVMMSL